MDIEEKKKEIRKISHWKTSVSVRSVAALARFGPNYRR